ncbi:MAG: peptidase, partial [Nitrosopumilaceae archaeon]
MHKKSIAILSFFLLLIIPVSQAEAAMNPNLFVSAENSKFDNHFSGSMVIEVVIRDSSIGDTDEGKGEPDVTINGKSLRMVQATDGNWYAYFANVDKAKAADGTVGKDGE